MEIFEKWLQGWATENKTPLCANDRPQRVVVIGSGIGGLASAALLAKLGHQVTVFEKHKTIGGHGRCPQIEGLSFSMGPQYVWNFTPGAIGDRFLKFLGIHEDHPFLPMNPDGFETVFLGDGDERRGDTPVKVSIPMGLDAFRDMLMADYPAHAEATRAMFVDMRLIYQAYEQCVAVFPEACSFFTTTYHYMRRFPLPMVDKALLFRMAFWTLKQMFDHHGIPPVIRRIMYGHGGIFAENESQVSALAYIVATGNYHGGSRFPRYGFHHFFDGLKSSIERCHGFVYTSTPVARLGREGEKITHVVTEHGRSHPCDVVISDIAPRLTYRLMASDESHDPYRYRPSRGVMGYLIGIKGKHPAIAAMRGRNYWWQRGDSEVNYTPDLTAPPDMLYMGSPSANGFGNTSRNTADDNLMVFSPANFHEEKAVYQKGEQTVTAFKSRKAEETIGLIDRNMLPGLRRHIRFIKVITSVDTSREISSEWGNAYGRRMDVQHVLLGIPQPRNLPRNLFNVSATVGGAGIAAGVDTSASLVRKLTAQKI